MTPSPEPLNVERLASVLADLFPVASRSSWPFTVEQAADALIRSGVTVGSPSDDEERSKPVCVHGHPYGLHDQGEDCATFRTVGEFSESLASVRVLGLSIDELRAAVATADQYHPQWRRSSQKHPSSPGE